MHKCCGFASLCALDVNTWRSVLFAAQVVGHRRSQLLLGFALDLFASTKAVATVMNAVTISVCIAYSERKKPAPREKDRVCNGFHRKHLPGGKRLSPGEIR